MNVLIACEMSGIVREAFRKRGHNAWSCDILPALDESPYHVVGDLNNFGDITYIGAEEWDLMIAHPPCTYLCNAGVWALHGRKGREEPNPLTGRYWDFEEDQRILQRWVDLYDAADFFTSLLNAPIDKICIENPVPHGYTGLPKYTQTIQPYNFNEDASKRTCLWLKGLPKLENTGYFPPRIVNGKKRWSNQTDSGQNKLGPSKDRAMLRSITYQGIADAMAEQWG